MFITIYSVFVFANVNLEAMARLCAILYARALFLFILVAFNGVKK